MGRRAADIAPVWPVAHAAGLQYVRAIWDDARIKRQLDRRVQAKALGVEDELNAMGNEEVPGDINIKGDETHNHQHFYPAPPAAPTTTQSTTATPANQPTPQATTTPSPAAVPAQANQATVVEQPPRRRPGLMGVVAPFLIGAGALGAGAAGMALYSWATDKPDSVTTITQPSTGKFEYRYGIEQRPTPSQ